MWFLCADHTNGEEIDRLIKSYKEKEKEKKKVGPTLNATLAYADCTCSANNIIILYMDSTIFLSSQIPSLGCLETQNSASVVWLNGGAKIFITFNEKIVYIIALNI